MPMPFEGAPWRRQAPEAEMESEPTGGGSGSAFDPTEEHLAKSPALKEYMSYEEDVSEMNPSTRKMLLQLLDQDIAQAEEAHDIDLKSNLMWAHNHLLELDKTDFAEDPLEPQEDITEWMEEEGPAGGGEEGMGSRQEAPAEAFKGLEPEGLGPSEVGSGDLGHGDEITEDKLDKLFRGPGMKARIQESLSTASYEDVKKKSIDKLGQAGVWGPLSTMMSAKNVSSFKELKQDIDFIKDRLVYLTRQANLIYSAVLKK
jgi:hypothetical protein